MGETSACYSRNCYLRPPLGATNTSLKQQVVCETRVTKTCHAKSTLFFSLNWKWKPFSEKSQPHLQLYSLISYIVVFQCLHKKSSQVYTSLQQVTRVLYYGPILQVNGSVHAKSGITGHDLVAHHKNIFLQNRPCMEFQS